MKKLLRKFISKFSKYSHIYENAFDLVKTINLHEINLVIDIGASTGEYAKMLRRFGYDKYIFSIEPVSKSFKILNKNCSSDKKWSSKQYIISKQNKNKIKINVSKDFDNSSILNSTELHLKNHKGAEFFYTEEIDSKSLDQLLNEDIDIQKNMMLKIDTQGTESDILESGDASLDKFKLIQVELSIQKLYSNQKLWTEVVQFMKEKGFDVWNIIPGYKQKDKGQLYQFDAIFYKK